MRFIDLLKKFKGITHMKADRTVESNSYEVLGYLDDGSEVTVSISYDMYNSDSLDRIKAIEEFYINIWRSKE